MSPYLWAGFIAAFFLKLLVPASSIRKHLGGSSFRSVLTATLAGVPLPLCSCGVLPLAAGLRREGGSKAGVCAFAVSTPQTGADSIFATAGLLGWGIAGLRLAAAFLSGLLAGFLVVLFDGRSRTSTTGDAAESAEKSSSCCSSGEKAARVAPACCGDAPLPDTASCCATGEGQPEASSSGKGAGCCGGSSSRGAAGAAAAPPRPIRFGEAASFAFVRLPADIGLTLLGGTLLAALALAWFPADFGASVPGGTIGAYALVSLFAIPVYVCSTGAIPVAFGLIAAGFPPGAAFILLSAGPSVSAASIVTLAKLVGLRAILLTCLALLAVSWGFAAMVDFSALRGIVPDCSSHGSSTPLWRHASAALLLALLLYARLRGRSAARTIP